MLKRLPLVVYWGGGVNVPMEKVKRSEVVPVNLQSRRKASALRLFAFLLVIEKLR